MPGTKPEDIKDFVWDVEACIKKPGSRSYLELAKGEFCDRCRMALLNNPSLFEFLDIGTPERQVADFINNAITEFKHNTGESARYAVALLSNPSLHKMVLGRREQLSTRRQW